MEKVSKIGELIDKVGNRLELLPPLPLESIINVKSKMLFFPDELIDLYSKTNGCARGEIRILPIEDKGNIKKTWDGILRANDYTETKFFIPSSDFLKENLIFAEIGGGNMAFIAKEDGSIWYENDDGYYKTGLSLYNFIVGMAES